MHGLRSRRLSTHFAGDDVLVTRGHDLLLARANRFPGAMYSALAGFVEAGESIEDCIYREVREEVGIEVRNLR